MPQDVPVRGNAAGGTGADFYFFGTAEEWVRRPPGLATHKNVFALYVVGSSMEPKFEEGELVFVSSSRSPSIGDYVVIELHPTSDGGDTPGFIKRLEKRTPTKVICSQFNPAKTVEFELKRVKAIHRVVPTAELLAV
jgi:phage repressor protein C with HTH and peptisase S24 domain